MYAIGWVFRWRISYSETHWAAGRDGGEGYLPRSEIGSEHRHCGRFSPARIAWQVAGGRGRIGRVNAINLGHSFASLFTSLFT